MDKNEILKRSRAENRSRDIAEIENIKRSSAFALIISMTFAILLTALHLIASMRVDYGVIATVFSMSFGMNLFRTVKNRTAMNILGTVSSGIPVILFAVIAVCEIFGIKP